MAGKIERLVKATADERARVRKLVANGQWKRAESDIERFRNFAAKRIEIRTKSSREAVQGDSLDFQPTSFLTEGALVRRAVAYVEASFGTVSTMGSGFMISPRLFITNQHVVPNEQAALGATITFDRELDEKGRPRPTTTFALDPGTFALFSDEDALDYAVIAVGARLSGSGALNEFGHCPLSNARDKHVVGMSTNIIQHPLGQRKLISIRNNVLVLRTETTLLYETDTQVGSSGSPVFNDDWEVVALHHWGEPHLRKIDDEGKPIPATVNEGIRISALVGDLVARRVELSVASQTLLEQALELGEMATQKTADEQRLGPPRPTALPRTPDPAFEAFQSISPSGVKLMSEAKTVSAFDFVVPLRISVTLDQAAAPVQPTLSLAPTLTRAAEAVKIDTNYTNRTGYNPDFITGVSIPMPTLSDELSSQVAPLRATESDAAEGLLTYEHFSLKLHRTKRIAIFTATNIDGETYLKVDRDTGQVKSSEGEKWFKDPRVSESFTLTQDFYSAWSTYFDRGHLTRRTDPTWGSAEEAERANADTFHFTNCSPQHFRFNQRAQFWQGVERYVLETGVLAQDVKRTLCVFQGPIFEDAIDRWADDVQIPSSFFKIVVWRGQGKLKAVGLVVDQGPLLDQARVNLGEPASPSFVDVKQWRVAIKNIEKRTGLDFGMAVREADTIKQVDQPSVGSESLSGILLRSLSEIDL